MSTSISTLKKAFLSQLFYSDEHDGNRESSNFRNLRHAEGALLEFLRMSKIAYGTRDIQQCLMCTVQSYIYIWGVIVGCGELLLRSTRELVPDCQHSQ